MTETTALTDSERETLLAPCDTCGHTLNDHGTGCGLCLDNQVANPCGVAFEDMLMERVAAIVEAAGGRKGA